jgi:regulator of protease activity HflC (stomatin/prohibitin superfamily)
MDKELQAAQRTIRDLQKELTEARRWAGSPGAWIRGVTTVVLATILVAGLVGGVMFGLPIYRVWAAEYNGRAILVQAEQTRQVLITQAVAEREAALARSEAIQIVGQAAQDFPEYRYQEFLGAFAEALKDGKVNQIIYVPTEANIPLMEAGRR